MWSFDRVVAGSDYTLASVQPVLHRYNDAKYVWEDQVARAWLDGFVRAQSEHRNACTIVDLDVEDGSTPQAPMVVG